MIWVRSCRLFLPLAAAALLSACGTVANAPSLERRPAERIDPRIPVVDNSQLLPADPALAAAWRRVAAPAFAQGPAVEAAIARARTLAAKAGPPASESWIAAQQALSAAVAAQAPVTRAIGEFDAAIAERIRSGQRLVARDLATARSIADDLARLDSGQRAELAAIQRQLAR